MDHTTLFLFKITTLQKNETDEGLEGRLFVFGLVLGDDRHLNRSDDGWCGCSSRTAAAESEAEDVGPGSATRTIFDVFVSPLLFFLLHFATVPAEKILVSKLHD